MIRLMIRAPTKEAYLTTGPATSYSRTTWSCTLAAGTARSWFACCSAIRALPPLNPNPNPNPNSNPNPRSDYCSAIRARHCHHCTVCAFRCARQCQRRTQGGAQRRAQRRTQRRTHRRTRRRTQQWAQRRAQRWAHGRAQRRAHGRMLTARMLLVRPNRRTGGYMYYRCSPPSCRAPARSGQAQPSPACPGPQVPCAASGRAYCSEAPNGRPRPLLHPRHCQ